MIIKMLEFEFTASTLCRVRPLDLLDTSFCCQRHVGEKSEINCLGNKFRKHKTKSSLYICKERVLVMEFSRSSC